MNACVKSWPNKPPAPFENQMLKVTQIIPSLKHLEAQKKSQKSTTRGGGGPSMLSDKQIGVSPHPHHHRAQPPRKETLHSSLFPHVTNMFISLSMFETLLSIFS